MRTTTRRYAALVAAPALALSLGFVSGSGAQAAVIAAPAGADPAPAVSGAAYLAAQPGANSILRTYYSYQGVIDNYLDYGVTIDAAWALDAVGGQAPKVAAMTAALEANAGNYVFGGGAAAKLSAFLLSQGRTGAAVDDIVNELLDHISSADGTRGRLVDPEDPNTPGSDDYNTPLTQAYALAALADAQPQSTVTSDVLDFALAQQCAAGFFRASFSTKASANQSCDTTPGSTPSIDTTALTVLMLQDQKETPAVAQALTDAATWLVSQQGANGSFADGNANSTGLAGWALGISGQTAAAAKAATWLRAHQLANAGSCTKYAAKNNGALTVDDLGLANAGAAPLSDIDNSVATRATSQALPALLWAPGGAAAGDTQLSGPTDFVKAGTTQSVAVAGAPGNTLCVSVGTTATRVVLGASGATTVPVTLPATTAPVTVSTVDAGGETDTLTLTGLSEAALKAKGPTTVELGQKFKLKVTGLVPGENVTVKYRGKKREKVANANGNLKVKLKATKLGKAKVKFRGEFGYRSGDKAVTVVP